MSPPLLSLVTVVRNDVAGLARTRDSVSRQRFRDFEWIVVDGDSEDGSREFLEAHRAEIAWGRSAPDDGLYDAMNIGLAATRGAYVVFLNAGDTLAATDTLAVFARALAAAGWPDFCYGDSWEGAGAGLLYKPARSHRLAWYGMFTHHQAMLYLRSALCGLAFDPGYRIGADYAFTLQALERSRRILHVPRPFCIFAGGGRSQRDAAAGRRDQVRIRGDILNHGFVLRHAVCFVQLLAAAIRKMAPVIFRAVRCRRVRAITRYGVGNLVQK